jgi:hypothetical protein
MTLLLRQVRRLVEDACQAEAAVAEADAEGERLRLALTAATAHAVSAEDRAEGLRQGNNQVEGDIKAADLRGRVALVMEEEMLAAGKYTLQTLRRMC